jgi:hypothetical protein
MTPRNRHVDATELAGYIDGTLSATRRADVEAHMSICRVCRDELVTSTELVVGASSAGRETAGDAIYPSRLRHPVSRIAGVVAAAVVALLLLLPEGPGPTDSAPSDPFRDSRSTEPSSTILTVSAALASNSPEGVRLELSWEPVEQGVTYRVSVTAADGSLLREVEVTDPSVTLAPIAGLESGDRLFWFIDATLANGSSTSTGVQQLDVP